MKLLPLESVAIHTIASSKRGQAATFNEAVMLGGDGSVEAAEN